MEDNPVKPLKSTALGAVALSALALASCSAGQVTQTSGQVAAVDGASAHSEDEAVVLRDVTVIVADSGEAALKFTAINQDPQPVSHRLQSVSINGKPVRVDQTPEIKPGCSLVADSAAGITDLNKDIDAGCIDYTATSVDNDHFAPGGNAEVQFTFDTGTIPVTATISAPNLDSGTVTRDFDRYGEHGADHAGHDQGHAGH
ncbi:hypothetical protein H7347_03730 [Corynebacterium sp. zg-331]|uniref:hypothetical protein n=1 Tax=unclassified Corynebacterium TaxID=2624378 RepID=UPI00128D9927|nr:MULTISPECIES: hypothetical protein [unclassified Corynebacterium]MBC3185690.1 hypothetical protein [Corynebacterium sp. zg-331]MPV52183.1 hypothetical protein [Corynebacterium sp. zg331]